LTGGLDRAVVVTGASTGIGLGTVRVLTEAGHYVFPVARKTIDARRLTDTFGDRVTVLTFDVTDPAAISAAAATVRERLAGRTLHGLVNNAGVAVAGPLIHQPLDAFRHQIEVNLIGQVAVIQAFAPLLGVDPGLTGNPGRIVNISSVGGKIGPPFLGAYAASKHGLEGLSESLRRELMLYGIDVILVGPGSVATPIWEKADGNPDPATIGGYGKAVQTFAGLMVKDGRRGYPPERVGRTVLTALTARNPKTRYAVVPNALINWVLPTRLPSRWVDALIAGQVGLKPKQRGR
jgi:NAD(P)-dependent dehydrogenase (short-subunit alcohol dehydrogenase family)